jgi:NAD(P)-dependent dehydrogenase (short-subunit alcohol dehydrogenase family)
MATNQPADVARDIDFTASARAPRARGNLTGHVAIVTGGSRGIGRAIAQALAMAGAAVTVASRSAAQLTETVYLIEQAGGQALAVVTDVTHSAGGRAAGRDHRASARARGSLGQ